MRSAVLVPADGPAVSTLAGRLRDAGWEVVCPSDGDLPAAVAEAERAGPLELLVVAPTPPPPIAIATLEPPRWQAILEAHLGLARDAARAALPPMLRRGRGNIVFVTSTITQIGGVHVAATAAAQGAVHGLMRALAREVAPSGVSVNAIAPSPDTPPAELATIVADLLVQPHFFVGQVLGASAGAVL